MNGTVFCSSCGAKLSTSARFCPSCGVSQEDLATRRDPSAPRADPRSIPTEPEKAGETPASGAAAPPAQTPAGAAPGRTQQPPGGPSPERGRGSQFAGRVEAIEPDAGVFASQLSAGFQTPGVLTALLSALFAALACFGIGLLLAVAMPDDSIIGGMGQGVGLLTEAFGQTVGLLLVKFDFFGGVRLTPFILVGIPIAACAIATLTQSGSTRGLATPVRLAWGAAVGVPFGLLMLIAAVSAGDLEASAGSAFLLGLVWGATGGLIGMAVAIRRDAPEALADLLPARARGLTALLVAVLKPLLGLLAIAALLGTAIWWFQSIRDQEQARLARSLPVALVENTLFAGEHGVNYVALGVGAQFETEEVLLAPVPLNDRADIDGEFRLFDLSEDMEAYFFVPLLIVLIALPALLALYAGFATARKAGAKQPASAAAWGALVGPVWAMAMALLNGMHVQLVGDPNGDSVFGLVLLGGAALGALGGLLASQAAGGEQASHTYTGESSPGGAGWPAPPRRE